MGFEITCICSSESRPLWSWKLRWLSLWSRLVSCFRVPHFVTRSPDLGKERRVSGYSPNRNKTDWLVITVSLVLMSTWVADEGRERTERLAKNHITDQGHPGVNCSWLDLISDLALQVAAKVRVNLFGTGPPSIRENRNLHICQMLLVLLRSE